MRALDTPYPISIPNESTGRASSRFPIRCLRVALTNPRNSTPLPAYDACYTIECGFHCATDHLPPIQIAIVRSSRSPRVHVSTRRDWTTFRDTQVEGKKTLRVYLVIFEILEFTFLYSYHFLASFECEKAFHDEVSLSSFGWINSNWVISRRDWFWKRTFSKMGTINTKCRYRYYIDLKFFHLYVYIHLYIHTLVCIFEMKIWIYDTRVFVYLSQIHRMNSN